MDKNSSLYKYCLKMAEICAVSGDYAEIEEYAKELYYSKLMTDGAMLSIHNLDEHALDEEYDIEREMIEDALNS